MKKFGLLLLSLFSISAFAGNEDVISCTFIIKDNKTGIDLLEESKYTSTFTLNNGQDYQEDIKIRRFFTIPEEDDVELQKKKAHEDVIFLFEKDLRDARLNLEDEDLVKTVSSMMSEKLSLKAMRLGRNVNIKIKDSYGKSFNLNLNGYGTRNNPLQIISSDDIELKDGQRALDLRATPLLKVSYQRYDTPIFGRNKMKTEFKDIAINFHCIKTKSDGVSNSDINKDLGSQSSAIDGVFSGGGAITR